VVWQGSVSNHRPYADQVPFWEVASRPTIPITWVRNLMTGAREHQPQAQENRTQKK
jgi:hypothetical protein